MIRKHKIFISYRRNGGTDIANRLRENFLSIQKESIFEVFQDIRNIDAGDYKPQLIEKVEQCDTFLLILSPHALDERTTEQVDWMREEIKCAIDHGKIIIPIRMEGFAAPSDLPDYITNALDFQGVAIHDANIFFEESGIDKICRLMGKQAVIIERAADFFRTSIEERWKDAEEISILAIGMRSVYESFFNTIEEKYNDGTRFRFLTVSHRGHSGKDTETTKIFSKMGKNYLKNQTKMLSDAISFVRSKYSNAKGSLEYRTFQEHLTCTIQIVRKKEKKKSYIFVEFWPIIARDCDRNEIPCACFHYGSPHYAYYENMFEKIWERAKKIK